MASDFLLEIDGINGESNAKSHPNAIEIESFSWGASNPATGGRGGGGGAGKASFQDIHFSTRASKASPNLFLACASGMPIKKAMLYVHKGTDDGQSADYYEVTLSDLLVTSYNSGGADGTHRDEGSNTVPTDQFSLNFTKIQYSYRAQNADGSLDQPVKTGWDLSKNSKI